MTPTPAALECRGVAVGYGRTKVLTGLDLTVGRGETLALLGPSGSGKTTLMAAVAGFVPLEAGVIRIAGEVVGDGPGSGRPPEQRSVAMVFQNYALWPHLTALDIVAYPLRRSGVAAAPAGAESRRLLERVGIGHLADRYPSELSGGQQQRVGLARALARAPAVYLFDEPTAHLDAALRMALQEELTERTRETGAAALYASHDPHEALAVADRVALLRAGRVVQVGPPRCVYEEPADEWAARLTGTASVVTPEAAAVRGDAVTLRIGGVEVTVAGGGAVSNSVRAVVRPEWAEPGGPLTGTVQRLRYTGSRTLILVSSPAGSVWMDAVGRVEVGRGDSMGWSLRRVWLIES